MTPEQYWDGDCTLTRDYHKAYELAERRKNAEQWRMGFYYYIALLDASPAFKSLTKHPQPHPYLEEPIPLNEKEKEESEKKKEEAAYQKMLTFFRGKAKY